MPPTQTRDIYAALDDYARNWLRVEFTREGKELLTFLAQYEIMIEDGVYPVVRFDGAHGFAHRDLLNRRGDVIDKYELPGNPSFGQALEIGRRDILANWQLYRANFLRGDV
jgi:hypothetical protein